MKHEKRIFDSFSEASHFAKDLAVKEGITISLKIIDEKYHVILPSIAEDGDSIKKVEVAVKKIQKKKKEAAPSILQPLASDNTNSDYPTITCTCEKCGDSFQINQKWVLDKNLSIPQYASIDDIVSEIVRYVNNLKCIKCKAKNLKVLRKIVQPIPDSNKKLTDSEKRFFNEGISGNREDNKKMYGRQSSRNKKPIA